MQLFSLIRYFKAEQIPNKVIRTGLTWEEVKQHCQDPETCSDTCTSQGGMDCTAQYGGWFDGFKKEEG